MVRQREVEEGQGSVRRAEDTVMPSNGIPERLVSVIARLHLIRTIAEVDLGEIVLLECLESGGA
jgi:hypothetical protein